MNTRATLKANTAKPIRDVVEGAWADYVAQLKENWGETPDDPESALGQAASEFWLIYKRSQFWDEYERRE